MRDFQAFKQSNQHLSSSSSLRWTRKQQRQQLCGRVTGVATHHTDPQSTQQSNWNASFFLRNWRIQCTCSVFQCTVCAFFVHWWGNVHVTGRAVVVALKIDRLCATTKRANKQDLTTSPPSTSSPVPKLTTPRHYGSYLYLWRVCIRVWICRGR